MKIFIPVLFLMLFVFSLSAQELKRCGTDEANREYLKMHPEQIQYRNELDRLRLEHFSKSATESGARKAPGFIYFIPVVFHIIHNYGRENISDEQVYDAINILNRDYRLMNDDTSSIVPKFKNIVADCEIEFKLATVDPDRNCTNGIDRIQSLKTYNAGDVSKLNPWPRDLYLNIWVVNSIGGDGDVAGYAYLPSSAQGYNGSLIDGILILHDYVGSIGTANVTRSRALTHEVGHYLDLSHTWGSTNEPGIACGDDGVPDTPITKGWSTCNLNGARCVAGVVENVQNYMEYSYCSKMFTLGQKDVMQLTLNNGISSRINLWQEATLNFTGAAGSNNENTCAPVADFNSSVRMACIGDQVSFTDFSWRGPFDSWEWSFSNATPAESFDKDPSVVFNSSGWQTVSLKVTGEFGQNQKVMEKYIYITDLSQVITRPFNEDFENPQLFSADWIVNNLDNNSSRWQVSAATSFSGGYSLFLNNFPTLGRDIDEAITPAYDLLSSGASELQFQYSYASKSIGAAGVSDTLTIYYSLNCGMTWVQLNRQSGATLVTAGNYVYNFIPDRMDLWKEQSISLPPAVMNSNNVRFKFKFSNSSQANNIFIDNININERYTSVINPSAQSITLNVYPVPSSGEFNVEIVLADQADVRIELFDVFGKKLLTQSQKITTGAHIIPVSADLSSGIYTLSLTAGTERLLKKISIVR